MKLKLTLVSLLLWTSIALSQTYPCFNGISTNPINPINNQLSSKANTFFNWEDSIWSLQASFNCSRTSQIESPFYKIDNLETLRESKDMKWKDGWELLRRGVGLTESNTNTASNPEHIYVILYNKYTSILRVLLMTCRGQDYNAAKVSLRFHNTSEMKTDLLEFSREISALDKEFSETTFAAGAEYYNDNSKWFYADFPMMYDPCTCIYKSKLQVVSELISTADLAITGKVTGDIYSQDVGGKAQIDKAGTYTWKDFSSTVRGKVSTVHGSVEKFRSELLGFASNFPAGGSDVKKNEINALADFLKNNQFLKAGLAAVPTLKAAVSMIDVFIGGGKQVSGPQEVKLLPLTVNLTATLDGSLTTTNPYHNVIFSNPGSKNAHLDPDIYPYYNEVLGIFNLIQTPEVWYERYSQPLNDWTLYPWAGTSDSVTVDRFKIDTNTLKYVLNPAARMVIEDMQFAIVTEGDYHMNYYQGDSTAEKPNMNPDFHFEGQDGMTAQRKFRTNYFDYVCFSKRTFKAITPYSYWEPDSYWGLWSNWRPLGIVENQTTAYLKIMINLRRLDADSTTQNVLYVATYPVKLKQAGMMKYWINDQFCNDTTVMQPADSIAVNTFCNGSVYKDLDNRFSRVYRDSIAKVVKDELEGLTVSPNPNRGEFKATFKSQNNHLRSISIIDNYGRTLMNLDERNRDLSTGYIKTIRANLPSGMYYLVARTKTGTIMSKFLVTK